MAAIVLASFAVIIVIQLSSEEATCVYVSLTGAYSS